MDLQYLHDKLNLLWKPSGRIVCVDLGSHIAMEARGRYARLCIQVDINKPLIDTILIGKFEQPVMYEGIHEFCFSYGRIGNKKASCLYTVKNPETPLAEPQAGEGGAASRK